MERGYAVVPDCRVRVVTPNVCLQRRGVFCRVRCKALLNEAARRGGRRAWLRGMAWLFIAFIGGFRSESQARALVGVPGK